MDSLTKKLAMKYNKICIDKNLQSKQMLYTGVKIIKKIMLFTIQNDFEL
jgi:hypothetical protein